MLPAGNLPLSASSWRPHERAAYLNFALDGAKPPSTMSKVDLLPYGEEGELSPYAAVVLRHVNDARAAAIADAVRPCTTGGSVGSNASSSIGFGGDHISEWDESLDKGGVEKSLEHLQSMEKISSNIRKMGSCTSEDDIGDAGAVDRTSPRPQSAADRLSSKGWQNMRSRPAPPPLLPVVGGVVEFNQHNRILKGTVLKVREDTQHVRVECDDGLSRVVTGGAAAAVAAPATRCPAGQKSKVWIEARQLREGRTETQQNKRGAPLSTFWVEGAGSLLTTRRVGGLHAVPRRPTGPSSPQHHNHFSPTFQPHGQDRRHPHSPGEAKRIDVAANFKEPGVSRWQYRRIGQQLYMRPNAQCRWARARVNSRGFPESLPNTDLWGLQPLQLEQLLLPYHSPHSTTRPNRPGRPVTR
mmetsp:Transcript_47631/g.95987  ORF Transcript_47631/g.95987 Transcript_47631/m.95987 type:complete len:412 (-) Transcript_47631:161-1396(-)